MRNSEEHSKFEASCTTVLILFPFPAAIGMGGKIRIFLSKGFDYIPLPTSTVLYLHENGKKTLEPFIKI